MRAKISFKFTILLLLSVASTNIIQAQTFEYRSHKNSSIASYSMPYRLFIPNGYDPGKSYPLVLFLHGAGERGTDNNAQINAYRGATLWAETQNQTAHPCFVVAPQCPADKQWVNTNWSNGSYSIDNVPVSNELLMVKNIIDTLTTKYNIDPEKLFVTGLSMGGYATWDFILRYPQMFRAAIPICGAGDPSKAELIKETPIRVFHSSDDNVVPVAGSRDMVNAINAVGPNTRTEFYTEYNNQGHNSWSNAYNTPDIVNWMFTTDKIKVGLTNITGQPGTITAQGESQPQVKEYAFDNLTTTAWLDLANANPDTRASWIQFRLTGSPFVATQYTLTSAVDFPERDPKNWSLLGSADGSAWTTLDTRTNETFNSRSQEKTYSFENTVPFSYYRLQINSVNDPGTATGVQLAELKILGTPVVSGVELYPTVLNLEKNDSLQLFAKVVPSNAINTLSWSSSNDAVASVSQTGLITAKSEGIVTITATAANNNKTATCSVVVGSGVTKYEAENATYGGGAYFHNADPGYSGTGFVGNFSGTGNYVQFAITGATAGNQDITLYYTTGNAGSLHLYVNGTMVKKVNIQTTGGWSNWQPFVVNVNLNEGNNTVKFQHDADDTGYYYIDYLSIRNIETAVIEIPNGDKENTISLFPNPLSTGLLSVKLPENATRLTIFDTTGKIVYQEKVTNRELLINRSVFKSEGIYIINALTPTNSTSKKIIVKQNLN